MKRIAAIILLSMVFITACAVQEEKKTETITTTSVIQENNIVTKSYESEVRLTANGFDQEKITVKQGSSLTIMLAGSEDSGKEHYLAIDGRRIAQKLSEDEEKVNIPFEEIGNYELVDETTGAALNIAVE